MHLAERAVDGGECVLKAALPRWRNNSEYEGMLQVGSRLKYPKATPGHPRDPNVAGATGTEDPWCIQAAQRRSWTWV